MDIAACPPVVTPLATSSILTASLDALAAVLGGEVPARGCLPVRSPWRDDAGGASAINSDRCIPHGTYGGESPPRSARRGWFTPRRPWHRARFVRGYRDRHLRRVRSRHAGPPNVPAEAHLAESGTRSGESGKAVGGKAVESGKVVEGGKAVKIGEAGESGKAVGRGPARPPRARRSTTPRGHGAVRRPAGTALHGLSRSDTIAP